MLSRRKYGPLVEPTFSPPVVLTAVGCDDGMKIATFNIQSVSELCKQEAKTPSESLRSPHQSQSFPGSVARSRMRPTARANETRCFLQRGIGEIGPRPKIDLEYCDWLVVSKCSMRFSKRSKVETRSCMRITNPPPAALALLFHGGLGFSAAFQQGPLHGLLACREIHFGLL